jgi:hypothetical protein
MSAYKNLAMKMAQRKYAGHQMSSPMGGLRRPVMAPPTPRQRQAQVESLRQSAFSDDGMGKNYRR